MAILVLSQFFFVLSQIIFCRVRFNPHEVKLNIGKLEKLEKLKIYMSFCNVQFKVKKMITIRKRSYGKEMFLASVCHSVRGRLSLVPGSFLISGPISF